MLRVAIIGATGHTGEELINVLLNHPLAKITKLYNTSDSPQVISDVFPNLKNKIDIICKKLDMKELMDNCDLVFLALPHTVSMSIAPQILKNGKRIIDLSADYRLKNNKTYEAFYHTKHKDKLNIKKAAYGLPELYRLKIRTAQLVANPGCYPTAAILALAPLLALDLINPDSIIIDAKSGVSGAGKKITKEYLFQEIDQDFKAYKINTHQHIPEINQILSGLSGKKIKVVFVPHLLPINRGIFETIYINKTKAKKYNLLQLYKKFYKKEPFVRIKGEGCFPRIKDVANTNFCDIGIKEEKDKAIIIAAIDNLTKGASGQAVQNMNIMYKFPETAGLL